MRLLYKKVGQAPEKLLHVRREQVPCLDEAWHFHPEYELILTVRGHGKRFVGDSIGEFTDGDLALVGPNLPHLWRNTPSDQPVVDDEEPMRESNSVEVVIAHFGEDLFGESLLDCIEMHAIAELFERSVFGLHFFGATQEKLSGRISAMPNLSPFDQLIALLNILHEMAVSDEYQQLASSGFTNNYDEADCARMNDVTAFLMDHFSKDIGLEEVAAVANLSPSAFCRYIKQRTGKTYSRLLNEVRVGQACKLLINSDFNISRICYDCGYGSVTNFNRQFKRLRGMTPSGYRCQHQA